MRDVATFRLVCGLVGPGQSLCVPCGSHSSDAAYFKIKMLAKHTYQLLAIRFLVWPGTVQTEVDQLSAMQSEIKVHLFYSNKMETKNRKLMQDIG